MPEAILNFLGLLGWTHPDGLEEFSLYDFIDKFNLNNIRNVAPVFDITKLEWLNGVWIRKYSFEKLKEALEKFYKDDSSVKEIFESKHGDLLIRLAQSRMRKLSDFKDLAIKSPSKELSAKDKEIALKLFNKLSKLEVKQWNEEKILQTLRDIKNNEGISMKDIYFVITGREQGLPLIETMVRIEGRENILNPLKLVCLASKLYNSISARSSNGRTTDSGSVYLGSNPSLAADSTIELDQAQLFSSTFVPRIGL